MPAHLFAGSGLGYLQALNDKETTTSFMRAVDVMLRYPGLCRFKSWWEFTRLLSTHVPPSSFAIIPTNQYDGCV